MPSNQRKRKNTQKKSKRAAAKSENLAARRKQRSKPKAAKKSAMKKAGKKTASRRGHRRKQRASVNRTRELREEIRGKGLTPARADSSADLEGLSRAEQADSESVEELVEEGNVFEAGAVAGVEKADASDEREVHTHQLPEDDVPDEYLE